MKKLVDDFLFGLGFGLGFAVANAVLSFIVHILSRAHT